MPPAREFAHLQIPLEVVVKATNNFADENLIGQGGFGKVYKGNLIWKGQSKNIAARRLHHAYGQGDVEFWTEIMMLASLKHENLVSIVGFCDENYEKVIVNEYEDKGSLDKYLSGSTITWVQRLEICVGVAHALKYIHYDDRCDFSVIHRNIKSSKILLHDNWRPKLSGFEISMKNTKARRHRLQLAEVIGTIGYVDPTYEKSGFVTHKSDVFSLGVVLFEVLCGRRAFTTIGDHVSQMQPSPRKRSSAFARVFFLILSKILCGKITLDDNKPRVPTQTYNKEEIQMDVLHDHLPTKVSASFRSSLEDDIKPRVPTQTYNKEEIQMDVLHDHLPTKVSASFHSSLEDDIKPQVPTQTHNKQEIQMDIPHDHLTTEVSAETQKTLTLDGSVMVSTIRSALEDDIKPQVPTQIYNKQEIQMAVPQDHLPTKVSAKTQKTLISDDSVKVSTIRSASEDDAFVYITLDDSASSPQLTQPADKPVLYSNDIVKQSCSFGNTPSSSPSLFLSRVFSRNTKYCLQNPLFTMKRLAQYLHSPNEELLSQLAKSHYEVGELDALIDPNLRKQMDQRSFEIFSETAYTCIKEQRAQRPNIDQVIVKLENALELQRLHERSKVAVEVEGRSSNHLKREGLKHLEFPLDDIKLATKNFSETFLIGSGGYGNVYKAELYLPTEGKRRTVAIKRILAKENKHGKEGFNAEIDLLTSCKHPNIVSLHGFCVQGSHMILVYEFVSNGSLDDYLGNFEKLTNLSWVQRIKICIDVVQGLNYLHTRSNDERRIIHRDIKSGNILLGKTLEAKIADFGLSRFHHDEGQQTNTIYTKNIAGTRVYLDPEYENKGKLKKETDIYSFGVVLFEILTGTVAYDPIYIAENEKGLAPVARRHFEEGTINEIVDPKIMEEVDELVSTLHRGPNKDSLNTFINIAYQCVAETQDERPPTKIILEELEKALRFQENHRDTLQISLEDIKKATQNFSHANLIGGGGFGKVYKGKVTHANGSNTIIAKRLDKSQGQGEHEFLTELEILFEHKHENVIGLIGYCNEKGEKIIVYELSSKMSLDKHLGDISLSWMKRLEICIDIARGLDFLHEGTPTKDVVIHRDIKSANILLDGDWKAKISDFGLSLISPANQEMEYVISNPVAGTIGYVDPLYDRMGYLTKESDIYSFGVVLFEIFHGKMLVPDKRDYNPQHVTMALNHIHEEGKFGSIALFGLKKQIAPESFSTFRMIVGQCLDYDRRKRPTAKEVLQQLNKVMELQEDYEIWEPKLPKDYKDLIQTSKSPEIYSTQKNKYLYNMFSKGILLQDDNVWFSIENHGERNEMISISKSSYIDYTPHVWRSISESRFQEVAEMLDVSNLMIKIETRTHFLSPYIVYGVHLVFKFCDSRKYSSKPMYVNLKYKKGTETLHSYFATWRDDKWMMIELHRFFNHGEETDFEFMLESLSPYYCGDGSIYVEGIEFRAIHNVKHEDMEELKQVQRVLKSNMNVDQVQQSPTNNFVETSKKNYDGHEKLYSSEGSGRKHLMLSAKEVLYGFSNEKFFVSKPSAKSRFQEVIEFLPQQVFLITCKIEAQMLSPDTNYVCYLVFNLSEKADVLHCPVKVRDMLNRKDEAEIIYFIPPSPWNKHDITQVPKQREDGWMEVNLWKFNSNHDLINDCLHVNLKLISYEGSMTGLVVYGLEFRPM